MNPVMDPSHVDGTNVPVRQGRGRASPWISDHAGLVPQGGTVLDLACGAGRHTALFIRRGHPVVAVDRDVSGVRGLPAEIVEADLEDGPWPLPHRRFAGIVVTNYLWRPLLPRIVAAVAPGGVLLYETFGQGQARFGRPGDPDFLLRPGELLDAVAGQLAVRAYFDGETPEPAMRQRIAAVRPLSA